MDRFIKDRSDVCKNVRIKTYPDGSMELLCASQPIFTPSGWEDHKERKKIERSASETCDSGDRARRRARAQLRDLALCTPFRYFVTLTLDKSKVDRYDMQAVTKRLNTWLDNRVRRNGLSYVLVPEQHKDGAIHFHGFFNDALRVVDSGRSDAAGHTIFNLPAWDFGFTTAIELYDDYHKAVAYVCKYIGKDTEKIGGRWYYSGGKLGAPEVSYTSGELREIAEAQGAYQFKVEEAGLSFVLLRISADPKGGK